MLGWVTSTSGGTDICGPIVGGVPILPVHAGEIQCPILGIDAQAFNEKGARIIDEMGELVIASPAPSMPLYFWNDPAKRRYRESYFNVYPGIWRHEDYIKFNRNLSSIIYGRSDSTPAQFVSFDSLPIKRRRDHVVFDLIAGWPI